MKITFFYFLALLPTAAKIAKRCCRQRIQFLIVGADNAK
jgi:hypothetical protein